MNKQKSERAAGTSAPACSAWTVVYAGPYGPLELVYRSTRQLTEDDVRERFEMDRPGARIERVNPNRSISDIDAT